MKLLRIFLSVAVALTSINLQANISPLAFKNMFQHFKPGYELYAPNIGCAALKNGTIDAIRFYNVIPGPKDNQERRLYIQDKAPKGDPFAELAILLFPSPAGQLAAITSHPNNIGRHMNVDDVATLLNFCATVRSVIKMHKSSSSMKGNEFGKNIKRSLKLLVEARDNNENLSKKDRRIIYYNHRTPEQYLKSLKISSTVLRLPCINKLLPLLCKSIELEERNDRKEAFIEDPSNRTNFEKYHEATFYPKYTPEMLLNAFFCLKFGSEQIQDLINNLDDHIVDHEVLFDDDLIDQIDLEQAASKQPDEITLDDLWVIQNRDVIDSVIPYARQCKPVNNGLACGYDRAHNQLLETETYPDCTETTLRHLCNLVFYDKKTKNWNLQTAQQKISDTQILESFDNFYQIQKPEKANSGETAIRNAWSKVVNNLHGNIRYKRKFLANSMKNDNEVASGMVNIMRVLNIIFNLEFEPEPVYENDKQFAEAVTTWITNCLETFFKTLAPEKLNVTIQITNPQTYTATDSTKDCSGNIGVNVGQDFEFKITVERDHTQFNSIVTLAPEKIQVPQEKIDLYTQHHGQTLQHSTGEQILLLNTATKNSITVPLHQLFSANIIDSTTIITKLNQLYTMMQNNQISSARTAVILRNALQRFLWQDRQMSKRIQPVLRNLYLIKNQNIHTILRAEVKTIVGDPWISDCFADDSDALFKFFTVLETINLKDSRIKAIRISGENCPNLKRLDLIGTQNLKSVELSGSLHQLEIIDLQTSKIETMEISGFYPNLKQLDLGNSGIKTIAISGFCPNLKQLYLDSTENLESLMLSGSLHQLETINLEESGIKTISISGDNCPNLKQLDLKTTKNLESLMLSGSLHQLETINLEKSGIKTIAISGSCPNLKQLFLNVTKNLESVVLSGSLLQLETINLLTLKIRTITISGSCPKLKQLDLRGTKDLESLVLLGSLHQLETINLEKSIIKAIAISGNSCPNLKKLYLKWTDSLESVVLSGSLHQLETIDLYNSGIKAIAISGNSCPNLKQLDLDSTENLESLELSGSLHQLERIDFCNSGIKTIEISGDCPNFKNLDLSFLKNLAVVTLTGNLHALEHINLVSSNIKKIAISGDVCPNLKELFLSCTKNLEVVTLTGNLHALEHINLVSSNIKTIAISSDICPNLRELFLLHTNNLKRLTLTGKFHILEKLYLNNSGIEEVKVSRKVCPNLKTNDPRIKFIDQQEKKRARDDENDELDPENTKRQKLYEDDDQNNDAFETGNNTNRWGCSLL